MIILLDFDSILYQAVYKVVSIEQMRTALLQWDKQEAKQWLLEQVYQDGIDRCERMIEEIKTQVQTFFIDEITDVELYITTCRNSFRKKLSPDYKSNRKTNKYVWMLREHYANNNAFHSDTHEADDLIAERARELGKYNCIVVSIDKDLKQIGGYYWSYYKQNVKDEVDENGFNIREYKQKEVEFIKPNEASRLFWKQMLMGDTSDNIKGLHRVGNKTADKILKESKIHWRKVAREYIARDMKEQFKINYKLLKL